MTAILLATRNAHKVREIREMLGGDFEFLDLNSFPTAPVAHEDASTFAGNAVKKARALAEWIAGSSVSVLTRFVVARAPIYIVADDSGLEVDALAGAPGVHSARFAAMDAAAGQNAPDAANNAKLLGQLAGVPQERRRARFRCVLAVVRLDVSDGAASLLTVRPGEAELFEGSCEGRIADFSTGQGGFGYDPLFIPEGCDTSFAQLGDDVKNSISHRSLALRRFKEFLERNESGARPLAGL